MGREALSDVPALRLTLAEDDESLDARLAFFTAELARLHRRRRDRADQRLLVPLAETIPVGVVFDAREVRDHATLHPALAAAIGPMDVHQLGMRLARLARRPSRTGLALERVGRDAHGCSFTLIASS